MNIGIMSMQRVVNYGSFLQAYGLKSTLEQMGHNVQFVDYEVEPSLVKDNPTPKTIQSFSKVMNVVRMLSPSYRQWRNQQRLMNRTFGEFCDRYNTEFLKQLHVTEDRNVCPKVDALVIGSDEVFNCTQAGDLVGYSRQLFGKGHRAGQLLSYAATFGTTTIEKLKKYGVADEVADMLNQFSAISVRDEHSVEMIEQLCGYTPSRHIDPVLLYDFPEVHDIKVDLSDYIVVYAYADRLNEDEVRAVRAFAKKANKKILSLGYYQSFCDEYRLVSPLEVLAYIKNADYVITDTFHGTVFSLKYQKQFATIIRNSNMQKLMGLLKVFDATDRCVEQLDDLEKILEKPLNAVAVAELLSAEQRKAVTYLEEQLSK